MKKNTIGIGLLILAGLILFQDYLPSMDISLWTLSRFVGVGFLLFLFLYKRRLVESLIFGVWFLILLNDQFEFIEISRTSLLLAAVFICVGTSLLFKPKTKVSQWKQEESGQEDNHSFFSGKPTAFSTSTRYVQDDAFEEDGVEVIFGTAHIYLDNAVMQGNQALFKVDSSFATVNLYVPVEWQVKLQLDSIFSNVRNLSQPGGEQVLLVAGDVTFTTLTIYSV